jgi:hypothetical protein
MDGRPELAGAWPPAALVLKGSSQGAEDGEPVKVLTGGWAAASWPGDRREQAVAVGVPVRGSLKLRERRRRERGGAVLSGGAPGCFYRAGEGAHAPGDSGQWWRH